MPRCRRRKRIGRRASKRGFLSTYPLRLCGDAYRPGPGQGSQHTTGGDAMDQNEVAVAFEIVLEEIENVVATVKREGAEAFHAENYNLAQELAEKALQIEAFRGRVKSLQQEWLNIFGTVRVPSSGRRGKRKVAERLRRGLRTPENVFRIPILQSLVELGGSAPMSEVLDRVEQKLKHRLNQYDLQPLPSDPSLIRWRNTAQWTRNTLVDEGLLSSDSPRGIWEITDAGRRYLADELAKQQGGETH